MEPIQMSRPKADKLQAELEKEARFKINSRAMGFIITDTTTDDNKKVAKCAYNSEGALLSAMTGASKENIDLIKDTIESLECGIKDDSVFANIDDDTWRKQMSKNKPRLAAVEKAVRDAGFKTVSKGEMINLKSLQDDLALYITPNPSGEGEAIDIEKSIPDIVKAFGKIKKSAYQNITLAPRIMQGNGEEVIPIKVRKGTFAYYYKDRNIVALVADVFPMFVKDDSLPVKEFFTEFFKAFKDAKLAKQDVSKIRIMEVYTTFRHRIDERLKSAKSNLEMVDRDIVSHNQTLVRLFGDKADSKEHVRTLELSHKSDQTGFVEKIQKLMEMKSLIKGVYLGKEFVYVHFASVQLKTDLQRSGDNLHGLKILDVGETVWEVRPDGLRFRNLTPTLLVDDDEVSSTSDHPHARHPGGGSEWSECCYGGGKGEDALNQALGNQAFDDLAIMIRTWMTTCKAETHYTSFEIWYDDRLQRSMPVLDQSGKEIKINDAKLIKSGEQRELKKYSKERIKQYTYSVENIMKEVEAIRIG